MIYEAGRITPSVRVELLPPLALPGCPSGWGFPPSSVGKRIPAAKDGHVLPSHDVVLVGGGGAGLRAAIAIAEANPRLSIGVVSKVYPMRSHTVSAEGGAAAVIKPNDSLEQHAKDTISGADWLADQDAVEAFVNEAPK